MKNLPKIFIIAGLIIIFALLFFYTYFLRGDIIRLKTTLKKEVKSGDIVIYFPDWEKNDILSLDGLPIIVSQEKHYLNLYGFKRTFIVKNTKSYTNKDIPILNEMLLNKRYNAGRYEVEEYRLPFFNLSSQIDNIEVYLEQDEHQTECKKESQKYKCGESGWQYVGLTTVDINGQLAECIWAHPIGGKKIIIRANLPIMISGNFIFYGALASTSGFDYNKPEIDINIFINEKKVFSSKVLREREWLKNKFTFKEEKGRSLKIEIYTPSEYKNHFCFNIEAF